MKEKEKALIIRQPYEYSKRFLQNRVTPYENRIMIKILESIKKFQSLGKEPQKDLWGHVQLYFKAEDLVTHNNTDKLERVLTRLQQRSLVLPSILDGDASISSYAFLTEFKRKVKDIGTNKGKVYIELHKDLYAYMCNLSKGYTKFLSATAFSLSNSYAIKMYYHICHWFKLQEYQNSSQQLEEREEIQLYGNVKAAKVKCKNYFSLEEFTKEFSVPKSYKVYDIRRRILDTAKKELDAKSEVSFNYTEKKEGRSIIGLSFVFYRTKLGADKVKAHKENDMEGLLSSREQDFLDSMAKGHTFNKDQKTRFVGLIKKYGVDAIMITGSSRSKEISNYQDRKNIDYVEAIGIILQGELKRGNKD